MIFTARVGRNQPYNWLGLEKSSAAIPPPLSWQKKDINLGDMFWVLFVEFYNANIMGRVFENCSKKIVLKLFCFLVLFINSRINGNQLTEVVILGRKFIVVGQLNVWSFKYAKFSTDQCVFFSVIELWLTFLACLNLLLLPLKVLTSKHS